MKYKQKYKTPTTRSKNQSQPNIVSIGDDNLKQTEKKETSLPNAKTLLPPKQIVYTCVWCNKSTSSISACSRCHWIKYCSRECQVADWPRHKLQCTSTKNYDLLMEMSNDLDLLTLEQKISIRTMNSEKKIPIFSESFRTKSFATQMLSQKYIVVGERMGPFLPMKAYVEKALENKFYFVAIIMTKDGTRVLNLPCTDIRDSDNSLYRKIDDDWHKDHQL
jgi:hypothetical protein